MSKKKKKITYVFVQRLLVPSRPLSLNCPLPTAIHDINPVGLLRTVSSILLYSVSPSPSLKYCLFFSLSLTQHISLSSLSPRHRHNTPMRSSPRRLQWQHSSMGKVERRPKDGTTAFQPLRCGQRQWSTTCGGCSFPM